MDKKLATRIFCIFLALLLALMLIVPAVNAKGFDLQFQVAEIVESGDAKVIYMEIENNTRHEASFGWVNSCQFIVTTSEGRYSFDPPYWDRVKPGFNEYVLEYDCPGTIQKIEITDLRQLDNRGLPGKEMHNITIYNSAKGISRYGGNFKATSEQTFQQIMFIVVPCLMVAIVLLFIVMAIRQRKKNKQAMNTFNPFGSHDNMHQQMHDEAHRQAMQHHAQAASAHQSFVNQAQQQQFHQASTTMDMGGFNPPPPPPPAGF